MPLTPNSPRKRLEYSLKGIDDPLVVIGIARAAFYLMGMEADAENLRVLESLRAAAERIGRKDIRVPRLEVTTEFRDRLHKFISILPARHPADFLIPWMARELVRLDAKPGLTIHDWHRATDLLQDRAPAIAQWAKETHTDIGKVNLVQAFEAIATHQFKARAVPQGEIVYRFDDGSTIQALHTPEQLEAEGQVMQHCVGSYCDVVREGESHIFSLRDPAGQPHVTLEWQINRDLVTPGSRWEAYRAMTDDEFLRHPELVRMGTITQVYGKQNKAPAPKYLPYIEEFIRRRMYNDPRGLMFAGVKNFRGLDLRGADFAYMTITDTDFSEANLEGSVWNDAELKHVSFLMARLGEANFDDARLVDVDFGAADLGEASLNNVETQPSFAPKYTVFAGANLTGATLYGARLAAAIGLNRANMKNVKWDNDTRWPEGFDTERLPEFSGA